MSKKLNQRLLQSYYQSFSDLSASLRDCKKNCSRLELPGGFRGFQGHSKFFKDLKALPDDFDFSVFEIQVKRRLVKIKHRIEGHRENYGKGLKNAVPPPWSHVFEAHDERLELLLKRLSHVDIKNNHQELKTVKEILKTI